MKSFLIVGLGRFGTSLAMELCAQGHEVLAVDIQAGRVQAVADYVTHCVVGDARDPEVLHSLGAVSYTHLDVYKRQVSIQYIIICLLRGRKNV